MKTKRILAWFLTFAMLMSFAPGVGLTAVAEEPTVVQSSTKENTNQAGGIIYTKTSTAKSDGTIDITLTAHTTGEVRQTNAVVPTDIVLVLDVSGSMNDAYDSFSVTTYEEVFGGRYTYTSGIGWWQEEHTAYGFNNQSSYYINTGTEENPVYTSVSHTGRDKNGYEYFEYTRGYTEIYVYPELAAEITANRSNNYTVYQFYSAETTTTETSRMTVLKNAVNSFIDTTETMNEGLEADEMHTISIVKFAGSRYSNNTTNAPVITEGNGTYTYDGHEYNYSQVVKGLTAVDEDGAAALKSAVASLSPAGSTAVDKGLALAEAVLMNRSQVDGDGAADRNEVIIVFTDGEPNYFDGFDEDVADTAIGIAGKMKAEDVGVTIYGVSVAPNADAADLDENINKFMHYVSSNYLAAANMDSDEDDCDTSAGYYMTPDNDITLTMIFESIIQNIDHPTVKLGEEATMVDTISPYFDFVNGNATNVVLQTSARNADGIWEDPVDDLSLSYEIIGDRLIVDGFDFDANYVSETGRGDNKDFYGKQLVVSFTVVPDYGVIDAASATLMNGIIPTNTGFASLVDSDSAPVAEVETPELSTHQVTYKVDNEDYKVYNRFTGSKTAVDALPTKEGYTFSGWNYSANITVSNGEFVMPDEDVEITGVFTANTYDVTYVYSGTIPDGASALPPTMEDVAYDTLVTVAEDATAPGYIFSGWAPLEQDVTITDGSFKMPDHSVTLRGVFAPEDNTTYFIEHYLETMNDGEYVKHETETKTGVTDTTATAIPKYYEGFTYDEGNANEVISGTISATTPLVLKLYYDRNEYEVTYSYTGDVPQNAPAVPDTATYKYNESVTVADNVSVAGYTFAGWESLSVDAAAGETFNMPAHSVAFIGEFSAKSDTAYKVEYYLENLAGNGYDLNEDESYTNTAVTGTTVYANNKEFVGFTFDAGNVNNKLSGIVAGDGSLVLKRYYARNAYTVTYEYNGAQPENAPKLPVDNNTYKYGATVTVADDLVLEGYVFNGWYPTNLAIEVGSTFVMPAENVTLLGNFEPSAGTAWKEEHYFQNVDGTYPTKTDYVINHTGTTGETASAEPMIMPGYTFDEDNADNITSDVIAANGSTTLKFYYERNTHNVTYEYIGTQPDDAPELPEGESNVMFGAEVEVADELTLEGYTFEGWTVSVSGIAITNGVFEMPDTGVVFRGRFVPDATTYTVEHYTQTLTGDYELHESNERGGITGEVATYTPLTITGFYFDEDNENNVLAPIIQGNGSTVVKLYYNRYTYKVTYEYGGTQPDGAPDIPDEYNRDSVMYGETVAVEDIMVYEGYEFDGWYPSVQGIVDNGEFVMPASDVLFRGRFIAEDDTAYTIEHYTQTLDGGYELYETQSRYGTTGETALYTPLTITGFYFDEDNENNVLALPVAGDGSTVLELYYNRNLHNVTYEYIGTQPDDAPELPDGESDVMFGAELIVEDVLTLEGYTFEGWTASVSGIAITNGVFEMPDMDVVFRGRFVPGPTTYTVEHYTENLEGGYDLHDYNERGGITGAIATGVSITIPGYTFDEDNADNVTSAVIAADGSTTLKFYYNLNTYAVVYRYDGVQPDGAPELPDGETGVKVGESVTVKPALAMVGYNFVGWYTADLTIDVTSGEFIMPDHAVTLLGRFEPAAGTAYREIHYLQNLDGTYDNAEVYYEREHYGTTGEMASAVRMNPTGFTFDDDAANVESALIAADGSTVLVFHYKRNEYKVTYMYDPAEQPDGAAALLPAEETYLYGETVTIEDVPELLGYTFVGWYPEQSGIPTSGTFTMPAYDVVFEGDFDPRNDTKYEVHHHLQKADGTYPEEPDYVNNHTGITGAEVTAQPRNFAGYTLATTEPVTGIVKADGTLVLDLFYDRIKYTVTYYITGRVPDGVTAPADTNSPYRHGEEVIVLPTLDAPDGITFVGWTPVTQSSEEATVIIDNGKFKMPMHNVRLEGRFSANSGIPYAIIHWIEKEDLSGYEVYTSDRRVGTTGDEVKAYALTIPGFTDVTDYAGGTEGQLTAVILGDGSLVINFYYDRNAHNVTYVYEGKTPDAAPEVPNAMDDVHFGTEVYVAEIPNVPGYTFNGWSTTDATIDEGKFNMPDKDVVLKGSFESNLVDYKVNFWFQNLDAADTFNPDDYTLLEDEPGTGYTYKEQAYVGQLVRSRNQTFTGFSLNQAQSNWQDYVTVDAATGEGNLVLNLYFDRHTYNVTYAYYGEQPENAPDLSDKNKTNVRFGAVVDVEAKPELDGYSFDGWYTRTATVEANKFTMPDHDVTFLGRFVTQYTVSYDLNGGTGAEGVDYNTKAVDAGTEITVNEAPTRSGYTFKGWEEGESTFNPGDTVTVDKNILFVAQWSRNGGGGGGGTTKYTLTYETNGGNEIEQETYISGSIVKLTKVPVKEGYVFEGWHLDEALSEDVTEVKMTQDITVYADWVEDNGNAGNGHDTPDDLNGDDHFAYVVGYPDGTVKPNANISRAEVTSIFFRLLKAEVRDGNLTEDNDFNDVNNTDWHNTAISTMAKLDIVNGRTEDSFAPDAFITRAEFAVICARFDDSEFEVVDDFADVKGHWAEDEIHEAAAHGWIRGYEDNTFKPDQFITRAEAMTMINRVLNRVPETDEDLLDNMIEWPDNSDKSAWYYLPVQEATNSHEYEMKNNVYEKWTALRDTTDWTEYQ